jgi:NAD(P)-dependent dehydrogenase (short-subunit alcohol dehydrogenase family)
MAINLRGYFLCSKFAIPSMLAQGGGSVIHVGSPCALMGFAPLTAYSASKGGIHGLTRVMAVTYAPHKIRVNCIIPGTMDTRMNAGDAALHAKLCEDIPLGRLGAPSEMVGISVFLASDESSYCTGGFYPCDGGLMAA